MSKPAPAPPTAEEHPRRTGLARRTRARKRHPRLDSVIRTGHRSNNFDLLRLVGALCVLLDHSFGLLALPAPFPPIQGMSYGFVGVLIFFSISGFLVARSWWGVPRLLPFALKRALRIMPAFVVCLLVTAFVLGPLVTTEPLRAYLENPLTKAYVLDNTMFQITYALPGVFASLPHPGAVNGSLWTLPVEIKAYAVLALLGLLGLVARRGWLMVAFALFMVLLTIDSLRPSIPGANHLVAMLADIQAPLSLVYRAQLGEFTIAAVFFAAFFSGAALFVLRRWIALRWDLAALAFLVWLATLTLDGGSALTSAAVLAPYVILVLAYRTHGWLRLPERIGDYSYGAYLYAFPVQQTIVLVASPSSGWLMLAIALPVTMAIAAASWHFVEAPALKLKPAPTA